jgi:hypothetical protein
MVKVILAVRGGTSELVSVTLREVMLRVVPSERTGAVPDNAQFGPTVSHAGAVEPAVTLQVIGAVPPVVVMVAEPA